MWRTFQEELAMNNTVCYVAATLAKSAPFKALISIKFILCLMGVAGVGYIAVKVGTRWLIHAHTRSIFGAYLFWTWELSFSYGICYCVDIYRLMILDSDCPALPLSLAFTVRLIAIYGISCEIQLMLSITLERLYAVLRPNRYEKNKSRMIGIAISISASLIGLAMPSSFLIPNLDFNTVVAVITIKNSQNNGGFIGFLVFNTITECISIASFHLDLYINFRRKPNWNDSVGVRYQIIENKRVIISLLPVVWLHFFVNFFSNVGPFLFTTLFPNADGVVSAFAIEILSGTPVFPPLLSLLLYYKLVWSSRVHKMPVDLRVENEADQYFKDLVNRFEQPSSERQRTHTPLLKAICCF